MFIVGTQSLRWSMLVDDRTHDATERLRAWADRIQASARTGLFFADNPYDRERYQEIVAIAAEMAGLATGEAAVEIGKIWARDVGYVTPRVGVGAAIFDAAGRLLLQKRTGPEAAACDRFEPHLA